MEVIRDLNTSQPKQLLTKFSKCTQDVSLTDLGSKCLLDSSNHRGKVESEDDKSRFGSETMVQEVQVLDPGYVIKAMLDDGTKVIVNVYKSNQIGKPTLENQIGHDGRFNKVWVVPHSFSECVDHKESTGKMFNFLVHPNTYRMGETNSGFYKMVNDMAISKLAMQFGIKVDDNLVYVDNAKYSENSSGIKIQNSFDNKREMQREQTSDAKLDASVVELNADDSEKKKMVNCGVKGKKGKFLTPGYKFFCNSMHASQEDSVQQLTIEVELPLVSSAATISVNIRKRKLVLVTREPVMYKLEIELPGGVNKSSKQVQFDEGEHKFTVMLQFIDTNSACHYAKNGEQLRSSGSDTYGSGDSNRFNRMREVNGSAELPDISRTNVASSTTENHAEVCSIVRTNYMSSSPRMPEYSGRVEPMALSFVFHVSGVTNDMTKFEVISPHSCLLEISSMNELTRGAVNFVCCFKFDEQCYILKDGCMVYISEHNVALLIAKDPHSSGNWDCYLAGTSFDIMEKREFLTSGTLIRDLDNLDIECEKFQKSTKCSIEPELKVTEMDNENLTIFIEDKVKAQSTDDTEATKALEIVVVHTKGCPRLQSILKQRTISESSDDGRKLSFSTDRLISTASDDVSESEDGGGFDGQLSSSVPSGGFRNPRLKKSVSFNERIDQAVFQANQTVSAMHAVLKNRRKRARKRDQYFQQKSESSRHSRRRCRSSGSMSYEDSGDEPQVFRSVSINKGGRITEGLKLREGDSVDNGIWVTEKVGSSDDTYEQLGDDEGVSVSDGLDDELAAIENEVNDDAPGEIGNKLKTVEKVAAECQNLNMKTFSNGSYSDRASTKVTKGTCDVIGADVEFRTNVSRDVRCHAYEISSSSTISGCDEIGMSSLSDSPSADSLFAGQEIDDAFLNNGQEGLLIEPLEDQLKGCCFE